VTGGSEVSALVLACGDAAAPVPAAQRLPGRPGKADLDPLLADRGRVVVAGTDADLAAVALRLLRTERLAGVSLGYVPSEARSPVAKLWGLPSRRERAVELALHAPATPVPLVRDDAGGVLLGEGRLAADEDFDAVAYCDDDRVLRGTALRVVVRPDGERGLAVTVVCRGVPGRRSTRARGRAIQIGCDPVRPVADGEAHRSEVERWSWYRHTEDLLAVTCRRCRSGGRPRPAPLR
jgi:hypothetical protein